MCRILPGSEEDRRDLLVVKHHVVRRIGGLGDEGRPDRLELRRRGCQQRVHVSVGSGVGVEAFRTGTQHVEVDHRVDVGSIRERSVHEIPGTRERFPRSPESDQENRPAKQETVSLEHARKFKEHGYSGAVTICPIIDLIHLPSVHGHGSHAYVIHPGTYHDVFIPEGFITAMYECADIPRCQSVSVFLTYSERISAWSGNDVKAIALQDLGNVFSGHFLTLGTGLAAFHYGGGNRGHMLLESRNCLAVTQF